MNPEVTSPRALASAEVGRAHPAQVLSKYLHQPELLFDLRKIAEAESNAKVSLFQR